MILLLCDFYSSDLCDIIPSDDNGLAHYVETELVGLAPLAGAAFTGNVDVSGTLTQGG